MKLKNKTFHVVKVEGRIHFDIKKVAVIRCLWGHLEYMMDSWEKESTGIYIRVCVINLTRKTLPISLIFDASMKPTVLWY